MKITIITVLIGAIQIHTGLMKLTHNNLKNSMYEPEFWETVLLDHFSMMTIWIGSGEFTENDDNL